MSNGRRLVLKYGAVSLLGLALAGCAADGSPGDVPETLSQRNAPLDLQDAYAIAHGMAESYATSANANPAVVEQLMTLDARAFAAVATLAREPQEQVQRVATADAVAALTNFAAAQTYSTQ